MNKRFGMRELEQQVWENCINKQLEPYGLTYEDVKIGGPKEYIKVFEFKMNKTLFGFIKYPTFFKKVPWYQYYTFKSEAQYQDWKTFCLLEIISKLKYTKAMAENSFAWLDLHCGLKQDYK